MDIGIIAVLDALHILYWYRRDEESTVIMVLPATLTKESYWNPARAEE